MKRRRAIRSPTLALVTPLVGCLGDSSRRNDSTDAAGTEIETTETEQSERKTDERASTPGECTLEREETTVEPAGDGFPQISAEGDEIPADHESELAADVRITRQFSADAPARLEIAIVNAGTESRTFGGPFPFNQFGGFHAETDASLYSIPDDSVHLGLYHENVDSGDGAKPDPDRSVDGCWQIDGIRRNDIVVQSSLEPCDVLRESYTVFEHVDNEDCLPTGKYRFTDELELTGSDEYSVEWGFTLVVSQPD